MLHHFLFYLTYLRRHLYCTAAYTDSF